MSIDNDCGWIGKREEIEECIRCDIKKRKRYAIKRPRQTLWPLMHELDVFFPPEGEAGMEESEEIEEKEKWKRLKSMLRETKRFEMGAGG